MKNPRKPAGIFYRPDFCPNGTERTNKNGTNAKFLIDSADSALKRYAPPVMPEETNPDIKKLTG